MKNISRIGSLTKRIYRQYSLDLLAHLNAKGFTDLRPSFLEVLLWLCENEGANIKEIGDAIGLKKQTMTSHLNELERRNYIKRNTSENDKRSQIIHLTEYGQKFKLGLMESVDEIEHDYLQKLSGVEVERLEVLLGNYLGKITKK